jgi:hypothetical protein
MFLLLLKVKEFEVNPCRKSPCLLWERAIALRAFQTEQRTVQGLPQGLSIDQAADQAASPIGHSFGHSLNIP